MITVVSIIHFMCFFLQNYHPSHDGGSARCHANFTGLRQLHLERTKKDMNGVGMFYDMLGYDRYKMEF